MQVTARGYSSRIAAASCLAAIPEGWEGGPGGEADSDASMESDNLWQQHRLTVVAGLGVAVYWESGAEWRGGWRGGWWGVGGVGGGAAGRGVGCGGGSRSGV